MEWQVRGVDKTLLLGNGLNRCTENGFSWADLMERLGSTSGIDENVPFPIQFEEIAAKTGCMIGKRRTDPYKELREKLSAAVIDSNQKPGDAHTAFRDLKMGHVVTTNYDTVFESMFDLEYPLINPGSSRNVLVPVFKTAETRFYHAHGLASWKNTLCLGHEHYASLIGKIRGEFYTNKNDESEENLSDLIMGKREPKGIWPELLFTTDVAIVGLGLDYSEIDLWWLLSMRAALFSPNRNLGGYENQIVYYKAKVRSSETSYERGKMKALESLGVQVKTINADSYEDAYHQIAADIDENWS